MFTSTATVSGRSRKKRDLVKEIVKIRIVYSKLTPRLLYPGYLPDRLSVSRRLLDRSMGKQQIRSLTVYYIDGL